MSILKPHEIDIVKRMRPTVTKSVPVEIGAGEVTWSGGTDTLETDVSNVKVGDIVVATIKTAPTQAAYLKSAVVSEGKITFVLSAANTGNDAVIAYSVKR